MSHRSDHPFLPPVVLLSLALLAYFWGQELPLLRLAPADFDCWHYGLSSQAGLYADQPELLGYAEEPLSAFEARLTRGRQASVQGPAWERLFETVPAVIGRDCWDLESDLCRRVSPRESDWVNGLFYRPDEAPFAELAALPAPGEFIYLYLGSDPQAEPLQLLSVPAGQTEGKVQGCRWYYSSWQIPTAFSHPLRRSVPWLVGLAFLIPLWGPLGRAFSTLRDRTDIIDPKMVNYRKRSARISVWVTAVLLIGLIGGVVRDPEADYVPPLLFMGGFLVLMAIITSLVLWRSALRQDRIFKGQDLLARWEFPPDQWRRQVENLFLERSAASRSMLAVIGVMMLVIGGIFVLVVQDEASLIVAGVLAAIFVLLAIISVVAPARQRRFLLSRPGLVLIGKTGVYLAGEFHDFGVVGTQLEGAAVERGEDGCLLRIGYSYTSRYGRQSAEVVVPVPPRKEGEAEKAAAALQREIG